MNTSISLSVMRKIFLGTCSIFFLLSGGADGAERVYYSIHLASFKYLQNANAKVNSLQKKGKMVFWQKTDVPGRGEFYRVFIGKYESKHEAVEFWDKLKREGAVSYFGIYEFKEAVSAPPVSLPPSSVAPQEAEKERLPPPAAVGDRFIDNHDGTVTDTRTHLMWIKNGWRLDFVSALTWPEAREKCRQFRHGGYSDWRLSTIQEWKSLIDTGKQAPALVEPNPFENIIVHMPYWSGSEFVFGRDFSRNTGASARAYTVMLYSGNVNHQKKSDRAFVLPVRAVVP